MRVGFMKMSSVLGCGRLVWLSLALLLCSFPGWSQQPLTDQTAESALADPQTTESSAAGQQDDGQRVGSIKKM